MQTDSAPPPTILVVDDEQEIADLFATWLEDEYQVRTAYNGKEALRHYDETVDVILLDRRMPDISGDEVLDDIRKQGGDCQVVMVTAVKPDFEILEMEFDNYVTKPVSRDDLNSVIRRTLKRQSYSDQLRTYHRLIAKRTALEVGKSKIELANNDQFTKLSRRITDLEEELDSKLNKFEDDDFEAAFRDLNIS